MNTNPCLIIGQITVISSFGLLMVLVEIIADNMQMLGTKQSNEEAASAPENVSTEDIENIPAEDDDLPF